MKLLTKLSLLIFIIILLTGSSFKRIDYREGMYKNVCKDLRNNILIYFIFVDSKITSPWTEFDIQSTIDSMRIAIRWIEGQAKKNDVQLNIISDYFIGERYTTVRKNLPNETVLGSFNTGSNLAKGLGELNSWADNIVKRVGAEVHIVEKDGIPEIQNPKNKERLVAHLRDEKQVESVVLLYLMNNYYRDDISLPVNHMGTDDVEFAIVSYKYPAVIAQNILNLFGVSDFSKSVYRRNEKKIKLLTEYFPGDIMQDVYAKNINDLEIGQYTKYLIGWSTELDPRYHSLLTDKIINY